jgi:hypothetical protein
VQRTAPWRDLGSIAVKSVSSFCGLLARRVEIDPRKGPNFGYCVAIATFSPSNLPDVNRFLRQPFVCFQLFFARQSWGRARCGRFRHNQNRSLIKLQKNQLTRVEAESVRMAKTDIF